MRSCNPAVQARRFRLFRFRSPLLSESRLIYFPPGTEMVHFPGFAHTRLCIQRAVIWFYQIGFPHSEILGSKLACSSPRLIAACHVLHRLLAPRHPPYALSSLTIKLTQHDPSPDPREKTERVLQALPAPSSGCCASPFAQFELGQAHRAWSKFAFPHCATLEQKFAVFRATRTLKSA